MKDAIAALEQWYYNECDGDWEHQFGITIDTLDNPGWSVKISIQETELQDKDFKEVNIERNETNWLFCKINNGFFEGCGEPLNLKEILDIFFAWARNS